MQTIFLYITIFLAGAFVCHNEARHINPEKIFDELSVIEGQLKDLASAKHPKHADEEKAKSILEDFNEMYTEEDEQLNDEEEDYEDALGGGEGNTLDLTVPFKNNDQMFTEDRQLNDEQDYDMFTEDEELNDEEDYEDEIGGGDENTLDLTVPFKNDDPKPNVDQSEEDLMKDVNDESELSETTDGDRNTLDLPGSSAKVEKIRMKNIFSDEENKYYEDIPSDEDMDLAGLQNEDQDGLQNEDQDQIEAFDDFKNNPYATSDGREDMMETYADDSEQW